MGKKEYFYLIKLVEERRKELISKLDRPFCSKKLIYFYLNKYDNLLFDLYTKYGNF